MALGIRGASPIWSEFDLNGKLFDGSFYMYVLQNTLPYVPAKVYHDPDLNVPWSNPIQFLANGTLPHDIFFESDVVYRLEFRKNNGINNPSQSDALIYEINNYVAGTGGSTPVDSVAFTSTNQITNPQFALVNFDSPLTFNNVTNPIPIEIGVGWFLELSGTGNITISQISLNDTNPNPSNASYALRLQLNGWDSGGVFLRQRFKQNGILWSNKTISSTLTARVQGISQSVNAQLIDSDDNVLGTVLDVPSVNSKFNEYKGYAELGQSKNHDLPSSAYIDYKLSLPNNGDIYLTSIQLIVQDLPITPSFDQESIERQIDHTYHDAYPIVPIGTIIDYYGFGSVSNYLLCDGSPVNRIEKKLLFNKLTHVESVTLTNGSKDFNVSNGSIYAVGTPIEGSGITSGSLIEKIVGNVITMSIASTESGLRSVRFFSVGNGDGSTTFNLPMLSGYVLAGAFSTDLSPALESSGVGSSGGEANHELNIDEMPSHDHTGSFYKVSSDSPGGSLSAYGSNNNAGVDIRPSYLVISPQGGDNPHNNIQPTKLVQKLIRYR